MMEALMEGERTTFLGYGKYATDVKEAQGQQNARNGYYERDLLTGLGNLAGLSIPRDRLGEFATQFIDSYEHSTKPMDRLIMQLYAKGMSTRDIEDTIRTLYGKDISPQAVTEITREIAEERVAWEKRTLQKQYTVVMIDALMVKVRRDTVSSDAVYTVAAIDRNGYRDILGQYVGAAESAQFWKTTVFADLKARGVQDVLMFVFDGLAGLPEAVAEYYPRALTQRCVVHQIRHTLSLVRPKHKDTVAGDLKSIYAALSLTEAKQAALAVQSKWRQQYPRMMNGWIDKIELLMSFLAFPPHIRPHVYTTNWIERINKEFRKLLKTKNALPTEDAVRNLLYFKIRDLTRKFERQRLNGFVEYKIDIDILWEKQYPSSIYGKEVTFTQST